MDMYGRFGQIFWGLLLVMLDVKINNIDLLPNFIGYWLIAVGVGGLIESSDRFRPARWLSWALVPLSFLTWLTLEDPWGILKLINTLLDCAMVWFLLGGMMDISLARDRFDLAEQASHRRIAYLIMTGLITLAGMVARLSRDVGVLVLILGVVIMLIVTVMILRLVYRVRHEVAIFDA